MMTEPLKEAQQVQQSWYSFPYHYIIALPPRFSVAKSYGWHLNYASAITYLLDQIAREPVRDAIIDIG